MHAGRAERRHDFHARLAVARSSSFSRPSDATRARCSGVSALALVSHADQRSQQKIGRLAIESGNRYQPAEIDQVMDPKALFLLCSFIHDSFTTSPPACSTPRTLPAGTAPK